jgi:hypothetical protein
MAATSIVGSTLSTIVTEITDYARSCGGRFVDWYVGIAADPRDRLFNGHRVNEQGDAWIYRRCESCAGARAIEAHFLKLGMDGGPGGGDDTTRSVYAYRKTSATIE